MNRTVQAFAAWIATIAILMAALAPSVSYALMVNGAGPATLGEVCTAGPSKLVKFAVDSDTKSGTKHAEHCSFCCTYVPPVVLPPATEHLLPVSLNLIERPSLFYQSPRPLFTWSAAQSRAPPVNS